MSLVSLKTELRQDLKLTPQLLQSMEVLQMNSQELLSQNCSNVKVNFVTWVPSQADIQDLNLEFHHVD